MNSSSLSRLRLITFDVTNTLLQFRSSPGKQYGEIGALFGVLCDNDVLAKNFKVNWHKMNQTYPNFGRNSNINWKDWWRLLIADTFADSGSRIPDSKLNSLAQQLLFLYKTSICWQHCNGSLDLLNYLRSHQQQQQQQQQQEKQQLAITDQGLSATITEQTPKLSASPPPFVLGIISNFDPRLDTLLENMKIRDFFDFTLNSYDCFVEKPDKTIFEMAINTSKMQNLQSEECLHIGDDPVKDYLAAKDLGWNAVLMHERSVNYLNNKYGTKINSDFVFHSLYDFHKKLSNNMIEW